MYTINDIANYFLTEVEEVTPKKLQKLCYYAESWSQALLDRDLIKDAEFEAWVHGPVAPSLYHDYKEYGWNSIPKPEHVDHSHLTEKTVDLLDSVIATYGDLSGNELEAISHSEDPWKSARKGYEENDSCNEKIDKNLMKEYYRSIYIGD